MRTLDEIALMGTALAEPVLPPPFATALAAIEPPERRLLLCAAATAAIHAAGRKAASLPAPSPALPDVRRSCSPRAASLVESMFEGVQAALLPEALARLDRAGLRLPHALLPRALAAKDAKIRALVVPLLDARGHWLAENDDRGAWVIARGRDSSRASLEKTWAEGTTAERRDAFVALRDLDAEAARAALEHAWAQESADTRASFVDALATGLSIADEALLERALGDRSVGVRGSAQAILARLPASAFVARMTARGDSMLAWSRSALAFLGKRSTLNVTPIDAADDAAERDGLGKPPPGVGAKGYWMSRVLSAIPLSHWEKRFEAKPDAIADAFAENEWAEAVAEGWTLAATREANPAWMHALWRFWQRGGETPAPSAQATRMLLAIASAMPPAHATDLVVPMFSSTLRPGLAQTLNALALPWSDRIGAAYVRALRLASIAQTNDATWFSTLPRAAIALPESAIAAALEPVAPHESSPWPRLLEPFTDTLRTRHALHQEIPL